MRLATPEEVLATMGVMQSASALANAAQALDLSLPVVEQVLDTKLDRVQVVDYFDYLGPTEGGITPTYTLSLTRGFVVDGSEVVTSAGVPLVRGADYRVDYVKGLVFLYVQAAFGAASVSVEYTSGFAELDPIPDTLKAVAITAAVLHQNTLPSVPANRDPKVGNRVSKPIFNFLQVQAAPLERPRMAVEFPTSTEYI